MLSWRDWRILFQAWILLLVVDLGLRVLPFRRVQAFATQGQNGATNPEAAGAPAAIQRVERLVDVAARNHLYAMGCLRRSLVLQRLLIRQGIATELRFGVYKEAEGISAHAWLEHGGRPIGEPRPIAARFAPLAVPEADR